MSAVHRVIRRARRPGPLVAVSVAYLALVSGIMIWRGISVSPDYLLLILVPVALVSGRFFAFLRDWVPFVALFLGYEALSGSRPSSVSGPRSGRWCILNGPCSPRDPSEVLQRHFGGLHWLVIACTVIYFCHFLFPIAVGMVLWLWIARSSCVSRWRCWPCRSPRSCFLAAAHRAAVVRAQPGPARGP